MQQNVCLSQAIAPAASGADPQVSRGEAATAAIPSVVAATSVAPRAPPPVAEDVVGEAEGETLDDLAACHAAPAAATTPTPGALTKRATSVKASTPREDDSRQLRGGNRGGGRPQYPCTTVAMVADAAAATAAAATESAAAVGRSASRARPPPCCLRSMSPRAC